MSIHIEQIREIDRMKMVSFLKLCFEKESFLNILNSPNLKAAYAAYCGEELQGMIFAWVSKFHPHCTYIRLLCNPLYPEKKIPEKLFAVLIDKIDSPLQTSVWETAVGLRSFYENKGFIEIRRTYMPVISVKTINSYITANDEQFVVKSMEELVKNHLLKNKLVNLVKRNYEQTHLDNPVAEMEDDSWGEMITADDVILNGSLIGMDSAEKNILAYSFLHTSHEKDTAELGWAGVHSAEANPLLRSLVFQQIKYAEKHNVQFIKGEFDTTDECAMSLLKVIPVSPCPAWITYRKE